MKDFWIKTGSFFCSLLVVFWVGCTKAVDEKTVTQWQPFAEWIVENAEWSGNPFDVLAMVKFTHEKSGETTITEMFYDDENQWKFRFTGTQVGTWTFITKSTDTELNDIRGKVTVVENPGQNVHGFMKAFVDSARGTAWGWQGSETAFSPQYVMWHEGSDISAESIDSEIDLWLNRHGFAGLHIPVKEPHVWTDGTNPDPEFFKTLETVIVKVHKAGGACHLWLWGDRSRGQVPPGGINSAKDKRLQRYICARLGPVPGWSAGYGFDLFEWVEAEQLNQWHDFMHAHLGWHHFLGARTNRHGEFDLRTEKMDYSSYELHKYDPPQPWYKQWARVVMERPGKPAFSEDRFRVRGKHPKKDVTEEETRRGLYYATMSGGAASIWGYLKYPDGSYESGGRSFVYPHPEWIKTWSAFFRGNNRFLPHMRHSNPEPGVYVLETENRRGAVIYVQDTEAIPVARGRFQSEHAIAVDTKKVYKEISLEPINSEQSTIHVPYKSDWVLAVGEF